jgi:tRNA dimethylallyltransferase
MPDQVPKAVVQERYERLVALQERISLEENQAQIGRELQVLVSTGEGKKDAETHRLTGRAEDSRLVHFELPEGSVVPRPGDVVTVTVTHAAPSTCSPTAPTAPRCASAAPAPGMRGTVRRPSPAAFPRPRARGGAPRACRSGFRRCASADPPRGLPSLGRRRATGTGKTDLSLRLAEALIARGRSAEIVNADAMQLYRGMDIGTAKLPVAERRGIPHHLFDVLEVTDEAAVAAYQDAARTAIGDIFDRGGDAILVGGSGLYVSSVVYDFRFPPHDDAVRERLEQDLAQDGPGALLERLRLLDPTTAERIDARNGRRIVRALEIALQGDRGHGAALPEAPVLWHEPTTLVGVELDRAPLVARLDERVERMWREGSSPRSRRSARGASSAGSRRAVPSATPRPSTSSPDASTRRTRSPDPGADTRAAAPGVVVPSVPGIHWVAPDADAAALADSMA